MVIGAGICGLASAILLREAGYQVDIWTKDTTPNTTSDLAGAVWNPYKATGSQFNKFGQDTRLALEDQQDRFGSERVGIISSEVVELHRQPTEDPPWKYAAKDFRHASRDELSSGYRDGFVFRAPIIDMGRYLFFLTEVFRSSGGQLFNAR